MMGWIFAVLISAIATAQIVMKVAAEAANSGQGWLSVKVLALIFLSFTISFFGQLIWFYVLRFSNLSTSYMNLSLVFVIMPLAGWCFFSEELRPLHFVSMALIMAGVFVLGFVDRSS
jgi:drug/metabolite transporter (DMT)-like permease